MQVLNLPRHAVSSVCLGETTQCSGNQALPQDLYVYGARESVPAKNHEITKRRRCVLPGSTKTITKRTYTDNTTGQQPTTKPLLARHRCPPPAAPSLLRPHSPSAPNHHPQRDWHYHPMPSLPPPSFEIAQNPRALDVRGIHRKTCHILQQHESLKLKYRYEYYYERCSPGHTYASTPSASPIRRPRKTPPPDCLQ